MPASCRTPPCQRSAPHLPRPLGIEPSITCPGVMLSIPCWTSPCERSAPHLPRPLGFEPAITCLSVRLSTPFFVGHHHAERSAPQLSRLPRGRKALSSVSISGARRRLLSRRRWAVLCWLPTSSINLLAGKCERGLSTGFQITHRSPVRCFPPACPGRAQHGGAGQTTRYATHCSNKLRLSAWQTKPLEFKQKRAFGPVSGMFGLGLVLILRTLTSSQN